MKIKLLPYLLFIAVACCSCSRSGSNIYTAVFGKPTENCVKVINSTDQMVPRLDCCIWLEFRTCPNELRRIARMQYYISLYIAATDTRDYGTVLGAEPDWWKPYVLGDTIYYLTDITPQSTEVHYLLFAKDSTHALYCDMAD